MIGNAQARETARSVAAQLSRALFILISKPYASHAEQHAANMPTAGRRLAPPATVSNPLPVRRRFAKHLQRYPLVPSSRYAAPGARKARDELTSYLLCEPPAETLWAVSQ